MAETSKTVTPISSAKSHVYVKTERALVLKTIEDLNSTFVNAMSTLLTNTAVAQRQLQTLADATIARGVEEINGDAPSKSSSGTTHTGKDGGGKGTPGKGAIHKPGRGK